MPIQKYDYRALDDKSILIIIINQQKSFLNVIEIGREVQNGSIFPMMYLFRPFAKFHPLIPLFFIAKSKPLQYKLKDIPPLLQPEDCTEDALHTIFHK